jgi:hypothetical protein
VDVNDRSLSHLQVFAEDAAWARSLLTQPPARATLGCLMGDQAKVAVGKTYIQPDRVCMRAGSSSPVAGEQSGRWLDDRLALARAAEATDG